MNTAARAIKRAGGENAVSAYLGDGRFATLLVGQSLAAAKSVAESLAKDFGSRESHHESIPRPTLTSAVVPWTAGDNRRPLAERRPGNTSPGRDIRAATASSLHGEFNKELAAWKEEMSTGNPFANVVAQDIMEPFPALLERDAEQSELAEALREPGIPVRPYVDRERPTGRRGRRTATARPKRDIGQPGDRPRIARHAGNDSARRQLSGDLRSVFVARLRDAGRHRRRSSARLSYVRRLSVDDRPDHAETFAHTDKSADELTYLVVPSAISFWRIARSGGKYAAD